MADINEQNTNAQPIGQSGIADLYQQILGRAPDAGGLAYWQQQFGETVDPTEAATFLGAAQAELANRTPTEQQALAPNLVNEQTATISSPTTQTSTPTSVSDLYQQVLGRAPDTGGLAYWQKQFGETVDPNELATFKAAAQAELANRTPAEQQALAPNLISAQTSSPSNITSLPTTVEDVYKQFYGGTNAGTDFWKQQFGGNNITEQQAAMLIDAMRKDNPNINTGLTVQDVYNKGYLEDNPDLSGIQFWQQHFGTGPLTLSQLSQLTSSAHGINTDEGRSGILGTGIGPNISSSTALKIASIIPSPIQPYAAAAVAAQSAGKGDYVGAVLSGLNAYGGYQGNLSADMTTPGNVNQVTGIDLGTGANASAEAAQNAANARLASSAISAGLAAEKGNYTPLLSVAANISGITQNPTAATALNTLGAVNAAANNDMSGLFNAAGNLTGNKDLNLAAAANNFRRAYESGNQTAIVAAGVALNTAAENSARTSGAVDSLKNFISSSIPAVKGESISIIDQLKNAGLTESTPEERASAFSTVQNYQPKEGELGVNVYNDPQLAAGEGYTGGLGGSPYKPGLNINPSTGQAFFATFDEAGNLLSRLPVVQENGKIVAAYASDAAQLESGLARMGIKNATIPNEVMQALIKLNPSLGDTKFVPGSSAASIEELAALLGKDIIDMPSNTTAQTVSKLDDALAVFKNVTKASPWSTLFDLATYTGEAGGPEEVAFDEARKLQDLWRALQPTALTPVIQKDVDSAGREVANVNVDTVIAYDENDNPITITDILDDIRKTPTFQAEHPEISVTPTVTTKPEIEIKPTTSVTPTVTTQPTVTTKPSATVTPTASTTPSATVTPTVTTKPTTSVTPTVTTTPSATVTPTASVKPTTTVTPTVTTTPSTTVTPTVTTKPTTSVTPTVTTSPSPTVTTKPTTTVTPTTSVTPTVTTTVTTATPTPTPTYKLPTPTPTPTTSTPTPTTATPTPTTSTPTPTTSTPTPTTTTSAIQSTGLNFGQVQQALAMAGIPQLANVFYYGKEFGGKKQRLDKKGELEDEIYRPLSVTKAGAAGELEADIEERIAQEQKTKENDVNTALESIFGAGGEATSLDDLLNIVKGA